MNARWVLMSAALAWACATSTPSTERGPPAGSTQGGAVGVATDKPATTDADVQDGMGGSDGDGTDADTDGAASSSGVASTDEATDEAASTASGAGTKAAASSTPPTLSISKEVGTPAKPEAVADPAGKTAATMPDQTPAAEGDGAETSAPPVSPPPPRTFALDDRSYVTVKVLYDRGATIKGHDHILVATQVEGTVSWTPDAPWLCDIRVRIPASSLQVDPPGARQRAGLEGETSDGDRRTIRDNALGKRQLEADRYPDLRFRSTGCEADGDRIRVKGVMTIHGTEKVVSPRMRIETDGADFRARGTVSASHADFGMEPYTALLGALRNDERLDFTLDFRGTAR